MPVKKIYPERKSKGKTKVNKRVKAEIKDAVEKIPGLIFEHVRLQNQEKKSKVQVEDLYPTDNFSKPKKEPKPSPIQYDYTQMRKKKAVLWSGVIILTIVVFAMWFLNASMTIRDLKEGYVKVVPGITQTAKQSWQETMPVATTDEVVKTTDADSLDNLKNQIKNNLISIFYAQQASTTVSSTN